MQPLQNPYHRFSKIPLTDDQRNDDFYTQFSLFTDDGEFASMDETHPAQSKSIKLTSRGGSALDHDRAPFGPFRRTTPDAFARAWYLALIVTKNICNFDKRKFGGKK